MKKTFHPLKILICLTVMALGFASCSKKENGAEPTIDPKNELNYNNETYSLNYGGFRNGGFNGTHINYEFHIFKFISENDPIVPIYLYLNLYSPNEDGFKGGTFTFADDEDVEGTYYFNEAYLIRNMNITDETAEDIVYVKGGKVNVSGKGNKFNLEFELVTDNDKTITGSYGGNFESINAANAKVQGQVKVKAFPHKNFIIPFIKQ